MNLWIEPLIKAAKAGDDAAARGLIKYLAVCLERGEVPPAALAGYFSPALKQIASGRSADAALYISGNTSFERDYAIAREVWVLNHSAKNRLPLRDSDKRTGAYSMVSEKYSLGIDRIQQIYREMKGLVEVEFLDLPMDEESRQHFKVDQHIAFAQLAEAIAKQGRN